MKYLVPYMAFQLREINGHKKWMRNINNQTYSTQEAIDDWHLRGFDVAFRKNYDANAETISILCQETCGGIECCLGIDKCPLDFDLTHDVLKGVRR